MPWKTPSSQPTSWAWAIRSSASDGVASSVKGSVIRSSSSRSSGASPCSSSRIDAAWMSRSRLPARVVERRGPHLLEQLLDHRADPHDLRRLLDHLGEAALRRRRRSPSCGTGIVPTGLPVGADDDDLLAVLVAGAGCAHASILPRSARRRRGGHCRSAAARVQAHGGPARRRSGPRPLPRRWPTATPTSTAPAGTLLPESRGAGDLRRRPAAGVRPRTGCSRPPAAPRRSPTAARAAVADLVGGVPDGVVLGPSMTALTWRLARALARTWRPGDEVVVSRLDHDANVRPWVQLAERAGVLVRWAEVDIETGELPAWQYDELLSERTRARRADRGQPRLGTRPDVAAIAARAHAVGALVYVDAVHAAPHGSSTSTALGADFLAVSGYTFCGPHVGAVVAHPELLEPLRARPAGADAGPGAGPLRGRARRRSSSTPASPPRSTTWPGCAASARPAPRPAAHVDGRRRGVRGGAVRPAGRAALRPLPHVHVSLRRSEQRHRPSRSPCRAARRGRSWPSWPAGGLRLGRRRLRARAVRRARRDRGRRRGAARASSTTTPPRRSTAP